MAQNTCSPQSVYGGWNQTLFLGLTVRDFSAQAGWGQQSSSLTVNLVYDNCSGTRQYLDEQFNWTSGEFDGDPGYNDAPVGSAALFKIAETRDPEDETIVIDAGFEFAGIIQSWNFNRDGNGQQVRTVTLTSPTLLLDGTQVIIDGYTAELPNRFIFPDEYANNVINAYGYLESLGGNCSDYLDPSTGAGLGSPAGGFGNAQRSERGLPWVWIKNAMQVLLGGLYNGDDGKAFANFPGVARLVKGVGTYGSVYSNEYIVDISDLPGDNDLNNDLSANPGGGSNLSKEPEPETALNSLQYRINGPIMTVSDIINQVTNDAGYDYFVDLYPTKNDGFESGVVNVVKVKTVPRFNFYPDDVLNDINDFIADNANYISTDSVGKELILDNTEALLIGAQRRDMFQVYPEDTGIQGAYSRIQPFFGYQPGTTPTIDGSGVIEREPVEVVWGQDPGLIFADQFVQCNRGATQDFLQQWFFKLDYNRLPLNFEYNLQVGIYNGDPETLLCAALGDFESWLQWLFKYGGPPENRPIDTCRLYGMIIDKAESLDPAGNSFFDFAKKKQGADGYWWTRIIAESKSAFDRTTLTYNSDVLPAETTSPDSYSWLFQDLATIYEFLNNVAETYYGKQFLIEVPFACRSLDPITNKWNYSDVPSTDGGYVDICTTSNGDQVPSPGDAEEDPDIDFENGDDCFIGVTGVIGLKHPLETDIFSDDVGKLPAILKFDPYLGYGKYHDEFQQWWYERDDDGNIRYPNRKIQWKVPPNFIGADFPQDEFYTLGGGFDTNLDFNPFQPVYAKCEVEESWLVINKPIYISGSEDQEERRCEYFPGDDTRPSYADGGGVTLNAIVKLPQGVFLNAGVSENPDPFGQKPFPLRDRYQYGEPYYGNTNAIACTSFGNNFRLAQFWNDSTLRPDPSVPQFRNPADMKKNNISIGDEVGMGSFPFAFPCNAILPIKSNTRTYGPFYRYSSKDLDTRPESFEQIIKGLPGRTYTEKDEGIAPWEYGGTIYMNEGANAKLSGIVRAQQESERGSVTIAGYPNLQMGGALNERPYYLTNRYGLGEPRKLNVKGYASPAGLKSFLQLDTIPATTGNKSQITDISTQVSPTNVSTSYTLSTFTPVNGRFSRDNADRLKQQAQERYKRDREIRASKRQTANEELSLAKKRYKNLGLEVNTTSFVERSPAAAIAGLYQTKNASPTGNLNPPGQIDTVINNVSGVARKEVLTQTVNQLANLQAYDNAGMMSMDGFFRPVRTRVALNSGLGPQLSVENDAPDILGDTYQTVPYRSGPYQKQVRQSETPPGPLNDWTGLIINTTYLDFLVGPYTDLSARSSNSGVGHDIELVARSSARVMGQKNAGNLSVLNSGNQIQYSDTYRYMAHRGPLVIAGWGYDLYGKPIPNANETGLFSGIPGQTQLPQNEWTSGSAYSGLHRKDYNLLADEFHSGFLSDPETWPVGPVDLRWDRKRSVWTVPNDFRIYVANLYNGLSGLGSTTTAAVYNADDVYDATGGRPLDWEIEVTMPLPDVVIDAEPILVYYSHESGQWWPIGYCCSDSTVTVDPTCLVGDTLIETPDGPKQIKDLGIDEKVITHKGIGFVRSVNKTTVEETYEIGFTDGTHIRCTESHPFALLGRTEDLFDEAQYVQAMYLYEGQTLIGPDGRNKTVKGTAILMERKNVYNLHVSNGNTYISNGVYSHNKSLPPDCPPCSVSECRWYCNNGVWEIFGGEDCPPDNTDGGFCQCYNPCDDSECVRRRDECGCDGNTDPNDGPGLAQCVQAGVCIRTCDDSRPGGCDGGCGGGGGGPIPLEAASNDKYYYSTDVQAYTFDASGNGTPIRSRSYVTNITGTLIRDLSGCNLWGLAFTDSYVSWTGSQECITGSCTGGFITSCIGTYQDGCPPTSSGLTVRQYASILSQTCLKLPSGTSVSLQHDGGPYNYYTIKNYSLDPCKSVTADDNLYFYEFTVADASSNDIVLTLPDITGCCIYSCYTVKKKDSSTNTVTLSGYGSDTIDGQSTYTMYNQWEAVKVCPCENGWYVL